MTAAGRLDGNRRRFRAQTVNPADRAKVGDAQRDEHEVLPPDDPQGILQPEPGPDVSGFVVVEAEPRVIRHPRHVVGTVDVKAFVEHRLVDAVRP